MGEPPEIAHTTPGKLMCGPPVTSKMNEHNIRFPRDEEGNVDVKNGLYGTNNQPKKATFKY